MKRFKYMALSLAFAVSAPLVACGDDNEQPTPDAETSDTNEPGDDTNEPGDDTNEPGDDTNEPGDDTNEPGDDTNEPGDDTIDPAECTITDPIVGQGFAEEDGAYYVGVYNEDMELQIQNYTGEPFGPGSYPLAANEADKNYEDCTLCPLIVLDDGGEDYTFFYATQGLLEIYNVNYDAGTIYGKISDAVFEEVVIDWDTFISTPVAGGDVWCVDSLDLGEAPECVSDDECSGDTGVCSPYNTCVGCLENSDCSGDTPFCSFESECVESVACTNDDDLNNNTVETAYPIAFDAPIDARICGVITDDSYEANFDYYSFSLDEATNVKIVAEFDDELIDIDLMLFDADNIDEEESVSYAASSWSPESMTVVGLSAGDYIIRVSSYNSAGYAAEAYTLTMTAVEIECMTDFDCSNEDGQTVCIYGEDDEDNICGIIDLCDEDDAREHADDGPNGATELVFGESISGKICGDMDVIDFFGQVFYLPHPEYDYFSFTLTENSDVVVDIDEDEDLITTAYVIDDEGNYAFDTEGDDPYDENTDKYYYFNLSPGTYFVPVNSMLGPEPTAETPEGKDPSAGYTITVTKEPAN